MTDADFNTACEKYEKNLVFLYNDYIRVYNYGKGNEYRII